jgi:hypothetical protein
VQSILAHIHASKSSHQHEKNASQNMRKGQNLPIVPSKTCTKNSPQGFKRPGFYIF